MSRAVGLSLAVLSLLAWPAGASGQSVLPSLPRLAPETYPPAARDAISRVHSDATSRPADAKAVAALARMLHAWEQWESAHLAYSRCQALSPDGADCYYLDGLVLQRLARQADAAGRFQRAVSLSPDYLPARMGVADALFEAGSLDEARPLFETLSREARAAPAAELGLGRVDAALRLHERAIPHFQRAIELFPGFGAAYYGLAQSYRALGRTDDARRALEQHGRFGARWPALDDPLRDGVSALRDDAAVSLRHGVALAEAGDVAGAVAAHEAALARDPSLAQAHVNLISLYGRAGNFPKAEENYRTAIALGADLSQAHYDYGVLLSQQEKWDAAADAYRKALAVNPAHVQARNNLGQIFERQRQFDAAASEYRQAVESQPSFRLARFNLGRMLLVQGRNEEAVTELSKLIEPRDAEAPRYLFALSAAYVRTGMKAEAITWATEARALALHYGQKDLAAIIERDLAKLK